MPSSSNTRAQKTPRHLRSRVLNTPFKRRPKHNGQGTGKSTVHSSTTNSDICAFSRLDLATDEEPTSYPLQTRSSRAENGPTLLTPNRYELRSRTTQEHRDILSARKRATSPSNTNTNTNTCSDTSNSNTRSSIPADTSPTSGASSRPPSSASICSTSNSRLASDFSLAHTSLAPSQKRPRETSPEPLSTATIRERQRKLLQEQAELEHKAIEEYHRTGDTRVFARFLAPFVKEDENGKRRKLGEWKWDRDVERHYKEDETTKTRIWAPVEDSFL
ncbi:Putative protein of unknown function [Podospora comata]|uniref:Uncharacterized protein n=1 Tax=Podospora comata TaxID=48703 RepID=A0ABY6SAB8_PODCO|nr:Putative protein of unknown function [Podospora comata]